LSTGGGATAASTGGARNAGTKRKSDELDALQMAKLAAANAVIAHSSALSGRTPPPTGGTAAGAVAATTVVVGAPAGGGTAAGGAAASSGGSGGPASAAAIAASCHAAAQQLGLSAAAAPEVVDDDPGENLEKISIRAADFDKWKIDQVNHKAFLAAFAIGQRAAAGAKSSYETQAEYATGAVGFIKLPEYWKRIRAAKSVARWGEILLKLGVSEDIICLCDEYGAMGGLVFGFMTDQKIITLNVV
jgi:hypothetical protein